MTLHKKLNIWCVIVTFNPIIDRLQMLVSTLITNGLNVVVVDNTPQKNDNLSKIDTKVILLEDNYGIATAQNIGIEYCFSQHADAVWFFDQDSVIDTQFIEIFISRVLSYGQDGVFSPVFVDEKKKFEYAVTDIDKFGRRSKLYPLDIQKDFYSSVAISSGMLIRSNIIKSVGLMRDDFFIDYVDTEWCLRAFKKQIKVRIIHDARMLHSIGDKTLKFFHLNIPVHSPIRRYYRLRNSFLLLKLPHVPKKLAFRELIFSLIHHFILFCTQKEKYYYIKYFFWGVLDGLLNRVGKSSH